MKLIKKGEIKIEQLITDFNRLKKILPVELGNITEKHFILGFSKGGGQTDAGKWQKRKKERKADTHTKRGKKRKRTLKRGILILTGALRSDIQRRQTSFNKTVIGTNNIAYADIHNSGLDGLAWGRHPFKMPKREFIGHSKKLTAKHLRIIRRELRKIKP